jgi:hypothetical protein
MCKLLNKLSTAWLILALLIAPLQGLAAPLAAAVTDACPMMRDSGHGDATHAQMSHGNSGHGAHTMHQQMSQGSSGQHSSSCPDCADSQCDDGQCRAGGCCTPHLQPGIHALIPANRTPAPDVLHPANSTVFTSLPPAAHYRPPV